MKGVFAYIIPHVYCKLEQSSVVKLYEPQGPINTICQLQTGVEHVLSKSRKLSPALHFYVSSNDTYL